jgi:hypothetical protein
MKAVKPWASDITRHPRDRIRAGDAANDRRRTPKDQSDSGSTGRSESTDALLLDKGFPLPQRGIYAIYRMFRRCRARTGLRCGYVGRVGVIPAADTRAALPARRDRPSCS